MNINHVPGAESIVRPAVQRATTVSRMLPLVLMKVDTFLSNIFPTVWYDIMDGKTLVIKHS